MPDEPTNGHDDPQSGEQEVTPQYGIAIPGPAGTTDDPDADAFADLPVGDDDLLFDPLLSDEPIDLADVRADDVLVDALGGGDVTAASDLVDPDDPLIAMLAAWAASARPEGPEEEELLAQARRHLDLIPSATEQNEAPAEVALVEAPGTEFIVHSVPLIPVEDLLVEIVARRRDNELDDTDPFPKIVVNDVRRELRIIRVLTRHSSLRWARILVKRLMRRLRMR